MGLTEQVLNDIDAHLADVRELISYIDNTQLDFKKQLQKEYRYFSDIKRYFSRKVSFNI